MILKKKLNATFNIFNFISMTKQMTPKERLRYQISIIDRNIEKMFEEKDKLQERLCRIEAKEELEKAIKESSYNDFNNLTK